MITCRLHYLLLQYQTQHEVDVDLHHQLRVYVHMNNSMSAEVFFAFISVGVILLPVSSRTSRSYHDNTLLMRLTTRKREKRERMWFTHGSPTRPPTYAQVSR